MRQGLEYNTDKPKTSTDISKVRIFFRALTSLWNEIWGGYAPSLWVLLAVLFSATLIFIPLIYIFIRAIEGGAETWLRILNTRIPTLFWNTTKLTTVVTALAVLIGVASAWLVARTDVPGKKLWNWALALPLVIPPYVGALTYIIIFGPTGLLKDLLGRQILNIYSLQGGIIVFTAFTFPYVYLIVSSAINKMSLNYEEAGLACGMKYRWIFFKVILPLLKPAIGGSALLVSLYVLSDFGAIAMLRYNTFSSTIYYQMSGRFDRSGAAIISVILIGINFLLLWLHGRGIKDSRFQQSTKSNRRPTTIELKKWKIPSFIFLFIVLLLSVLLPLGILVYWSIKGVANGAINIRFWGYVWNSVSISLKASIICMGLSIPIAYLKSRHSSKLSNGLYQLIYTGYVIPGVIVALGIIFIFNRFVPWLYATSYMVLFAYIIRFLPQNIQSTSSILTMVPIRLDEAGKSLGQNQLGVIRRIITPIISPGILSGGALVFVSAIKELPTTLLLRPAGFDTLSVRIWLEASEGFYYSAAPAALLIVLVSILPLKWMLKKY